VPRRGQLFVYRRNWSAGKAPQWKRGHNCDQELGLNCAYREKPFILGLALGWTARASAAGWRIDDSTVSNDGASNLWLAATLAIRA
jgi:hypothetical protein